MSKHAEWVRQWRKSHRDAGVCIHCNALAVNGLSTCQKHTDALEAATNRYAAKVGVEVLNERKRCRRRKIAEVSGVRRIHCAWCGGVGHNRRGCPQVIAISGEV